MKKQRIYISGAMTAPTQEEQARNVQAFHDCATLLLASGCRPVNPARCWACRFKWLYKAMERLLGKDGAYRTVLLRPLAAIPLRQHLHDRRMAAVEGCED
jgi:hypothetical protein